MAAEDKLTVILPTRFSPKMRRALNAYAQQSQLHEGEVIRIAVEKFLSKRSAKLQRIATNERAQPAPAV